MCFLLLSVLFFSMLGDSGWKLIKNRILFRDAVDNQKPI
jgi:hypothetical protein